MKPQMEEILANELDGTNNWYELSILYEWTIEEMRLLKKYLNWNAMLNIKNDISFDIIKELLDDNIINLNNVNTRVNILLQKDITKQFILENIKYYNMDEIALTKIFSPRELIGLFGKPSVGDGGTILKGSDRYPFTIIESKKNTIKMTVQEDISIKDKNYDYYGNQIYSFERNPNGKTYIVKLNKNGQWIANGMVFVMGPRSRYNSIDI